MTKIKILSLISGFVITITPLVGGTADNTQGRNNEPGPSDRRQNDSMYRPSPTPSDTSTKPKKHREAKKSREKEDTGTTDSSNLRPENPERRDKPVTRSPHSPTGNPETGR